MVVLFKKTALLTLMAFCLSMQMAMAQTNYTLADYIDSALRHMPVLLQKQALVDAAKAGIKDAKHAFLPTAFVGDEITLGTDNSIPGSYLSYGIIPSASGGMHASNDFQSAIGNIAIFQSQYELADFGLRKSRIQNATAYTNLSQADLEKERYLIKWQIGKLYFDWLKNQFQLAIDFQNIDRYKASYSVIQALTKSGIKPGADSSLALAELSKSRITYNQTKGQIRILQQQLSYMTGIAADAFSIDTASTKKYLFALQGLVNESMDSLNSNPLIDYYVKEKALYLQTEDLVKKSYLPKIFLSATGWARGSSIDYTGNYNTLSEGLGYQRCNYMLGATFVYDLFNMVHKKDKLAISQYNTKASDYNLQQQQLSMNNVSNQASESIHTSLKNLLEIPIQIKASQDTYDQKTAQYKAGIINLIDLTNASFVLYRAQSDYVETLSDWLLANLNKAGATGNLDSFIKTIK